jgi:NTE family protein
MQIRGKYERYFPLNRKFTIGTYGELVISTRKLLETYTASIIQLPAFQPTPHSISIYNPAFRANQFFAAGVKPIYHLTNQLHVRTEAYWFLPYKTLNRTVTDKPYYSKAFGSSQFIVESSLVLTFQKVTAGMYLKYYSAGKSRLNFGVNIGILLFNDKFLD